MSDTPQERGAGLAKKRRGWAIASFGAAVVLVAVSLVPDDRWRPLVRVSMTARGALTLGETVAAILMLGIAVAVTVPTLVGIDEDDAALLAVADVLRALVRRARLTAIARGQPVTLTLDVRLGSWIMEAERDGGAMTIADGQLILPGGVEFAASGPLARWRCTADGAISADTLALRSRSRTKRIVADS